MYFPYFLAYMVLGFVIALPALLWALRSGQFRNQDRARFLALERNDVAGGAPMAVSRRCRIEAFGLILLVTLGLASTACVLVFALMH